MKGERITDREWSGWVKPRMLATTGTQSREAAVVVSKEEGEGPGKGLSVELGLSAVRWLILCVSLTGTGDLHTAG